MLRPSIAACLLALGAAASGASAATAASAPGVAAPASAPAATVTTTTTTTTVTVGPAPGHRAVFVIAMENHDAREIYGNTKDAPWINRVLMRDGAHATNFVDELPAEIPSEPHYVWMEAGTNRFADRTFDDDQDPSRTNSTASPDHLATQLRATNGRVDWRAYQEAMTASHAGACPISSEGRYGAKHDPFVFFRDVAGSPPSKKNAYCASHHRDFSAFAGDLARNDVAAYTFITPDLCNDMHGARECANENSIRLGDRWLERHLPALLAWAQAHDGVVFITWDEGEATDHMAFLALGPHVRKGHASTVKYTHGSMLKTVEEILQVPVLPTVAGENDLADLFEPGTLP